MLISLLKFKKKTIFFPSPNYPVTLDFPCFIYTDGGTQKGEGSKVKNPSENSDYPYRHLPGGGGGQEQDWFPLICSNVLVV